MILGILDIHMQQNEGGPLLNTKSKLTTDLIRRGKTIKTLENNAGQKLHDIRYENDFLDVTPKAKVTKERKPNGSS